MLLRDKHILVTGAASGIGAAAAHEFAAEGAVLTLCDRDADRLAAVSAALRGLGHHCRSEVGDVTDTAAMARIIDAMPRLDGAFNNAGIEGNGGRLAPAMDYPDDEFDRLIAINLKAMWGCLRLQLRRMLPAGAGSIVNTTSIAGVAGAPGQAAYASSKHGVVGLTRSIAIEVAGQGVRINAVAPGMTETPMILERGLKQNPGLLEKALAAIPMGRLGRAEEVAAAAAWLLSDKAGYVTGQVIAVDGGLTTG